MRIRYNKLQKLMIVQTVCTIWARLNYKTMKRGSGYGKRPV